MLGAVITNPADLLIQQWNSGISGTKRFRPYGPNTFARVLVRQLSIVGRSPGLKNEPSVLITVARPRGSLTRFPILPVETGHPNAELRKIFFAVENAARHYHASLLGVKLMTRQRDCKRMRQRMSDTL
jgi:hypothetical protein